MTRNGFHSENKYRLTQSHVMSVKNRMVHVIRLIVMCGRARYILYIWSVEQIVEQKRHLSNFPLSEPTHFIAIAYEK